MTLDFLGSSWKEKQKMNEESSIEVRYLNGYQEAREAIELVNPEFDYGDPVKNEIAQSIKQDFSHLLNDVAEYLKAADAEDMYVQRKGREIDPDVKATLEDLGKTRTATHNMLISSINNVEFYMKKLGIDTGLIRAIVSMDRKLDPKNYSDRRSVEYWARAVAKYMAAVSATTLKS